MANPVEVLPLLVVALVLMGASGADVTAIEVAVDGDRTVTEVEDVIVVGGGTATVPEDERLNGSVYVIGGTVTVAGTVEGDVVQLAGVLELAGTATVTGELQTIGGETAVAPGASVARRTDVPAALTPRPRSLAEQLLTLLVQAGVLAVAAWLLARRNPRVLENVGDAVAAHPVVSGAVGVLAAATGVAVVVFMAFTVILLPVSLLGLVVGVLTAGFASLGLGALVGRRLPVGSPPRAAALGVVVVVVGLDLLGRVPLVGGVAVLLILLVGVGAVLLTYYGLRGFEPVQLPG